MFEIKFTHDNTLSNLYKLISVYAYSEYVDKEYKQ